MKQTILISILVATVLLTQCTKTENSMTITNISPTTVQAGSLTEVTLTGTNFEASVTAMLINVGGVNMQPTSATSTQLKFYVSPTATVGTQKLEVLNTKTSQSVKSTQDFTITSSNPITITDINPKTFSLSNNNTETITITGTGFNTDKSKMMISLGGINLAAYSSSATSLTFVINNSLPNISTGVFKIGIKDINTTNDEVKSTQDFTITQ